MHSFLYYRIIVLARDSGMQLAATTQVWVIMLWIIWWREGSKQTEEAILGDFRSVCTNRHAIVTQSLQRCSAVKQNRIQLILPKLSP